MKTLRSDLEKSLINIGFLGAVLMTCVLCFTAQAYSDTSNGQSFSVFEALFRLDKRLILSDSSLSSVSIFQKALSGYITMFLPIIVAFPFMISFCTERNSGLMRFTITRSGKWRYYLSKFFSAVIGGGLSVMLGVALFGILTAILFPSLSGYDVPAEQLEWLLPNGYGVMIARMLGTAFLYGALSTLPALFLSSFCRNPYIITCLPFMLNYVRDTGINKLIQAAFTEQDVEKAMWYQSFSSYAVTALTYQTELDRMLKTALIFNALMVAFLLAGFIIILELRWDKGV